MRKLLAVIALLLTASTAHAATATPVTITSATVAGSTVTVNATAHGLLAANPSGFCISGSTVSSLNACGVVATVPTANSFTFTLAGASACAASCGTVTPAKRVIWISTEQVQGGYNVSYLLWIATQSPIGEPPTSWAGASATEAAAVTAGKFLEKSRTQFFPSGTTLASAELYMSTDWTATQASQTGGVQPGTFAGNFFDGTGWVQ